MTCKTCGCDHMGCTAHTRAGKPCGKPPERGMKVCRMHGAASPNAIAKRDEREAEEEIKAMLSYATKKDIAPTQALIDEIQWTAGHVDFLRSMIQEVDPRALYEGDVQVTEMEADLTMSQGTTTTTVTGQRIHKLMEMYWKERAHLVNVSAMAVKLGLEERKVKLAENQGALVARVIRNILGDLELTPEQAGRVPNVVPFRLKELAAEATL